MFKDKTHVSAEGLRMFERIWYPTDFSEHADKLAGAER